LVQKDKAFIFFGHARQSKKLLTEKYLKENGSIQAMDRINRDNLYNDKSYRIRCMKGLLKQIKEDHDECSRLWKRLENGAGNVFEIEELVKGQAWLKEELNTFKEMRDRAIEGISWGEIEHIEKEVKEKETNIKLLLYSISMEMKNIHIR